MCSLTRFAEHACFDSRHREEFEAVENPMSKRKLSNFLLFPGLQIRHGLLLLGIATLIHLFLTGVGVFVIDAWLAGKPGIGDLPFWKIGVGLASVYGVYLIFLFLLGIYVSHRWIGPLVAIDRHVDALVKGDHAHRLFLRKGTLPHLKKLGDSLNTLAERLERKS